MFTDEHSIAARIANAPVSVVRYLENTFWPHNLAVFYQFSDNLPLWQVFGSTLLIIIISIAVIMAWKKLPYIFIGWLWFTVALLPVIGIIRSTSHSMHDCYTYLPSIGIAVMLAWGVPLLLPNKNIYKRILFAAAIVSLCVLTILTGQQCRYWENSKALWSHSLQVIENNYLAHNNLGSVLYKKGMTAEAMEHFNKAIGLKPDLADAWYNRGNVWAAWRMYDAAIKDYNEAIRLIPIYEKAYNNRGAAYYDTGLYERAIENYSEAIHLNPDYADPYLNRGIAYDKLGKYRQAIEDFNETIRLNENYAYAWDRRGVNYLMLGDVDSGCRDLQKACELGNCGTLEDVRSRGTCR